MFRINLNDPVKVKLTDYGKGVVATNHTDLGCLADPLSGYDENGHASFQLHQLFSYFGSECDWNLGFSNERPFEEGNIYLLNNGEFVLDKYILRV